MHISELHTFVADDREFSMKFVISLGEVVEVKRCVCTSFYSKGRTINIKFLDSGEFRKVIRWSILEINNQPLYL